MLSAPFGDAALGGLLSRVLRRLRLGAIQPAALDQLIEIAAADAHGAVNSDPGKLTSVDHLVDQTPADIQNPGCFRNGQQGIFSFGRKCLRNAERCKVRGFLKDPLSSGRSVPGHRFPPCVHWQFKCMGKRGGSSGAPLSRDPQAGAGRWRRKSHIPFYRTLVLVSSPAVVHTVHGSSHSAHSAENPGTEVAVGKSG